MTCNSKPFHELVHDTITCVPERSTLNTGACGDPDPPAGANTNVPLVAT
jgi:hypothetical protein